MQVLWDLQSATVADVVSRLKSNYSTVQTMLRILETKGYVAHEKAGRAFAYRPLDRPDASAPARAQSSGLGTLQQLAEPARAQRARRRADRSARARPAPPVDHGERIVESALPALVNWLWQGSAIALAATAILRPSRRISATTRYQLWWIALFIVLALPILSFQLPAPSFQQEPATSHAREFAAGAGAGSVPGSASWKLEAGSWKLPPLDRRAAGIPVARDRNGFSLTDGGRSRRAPASQAHGAPISGSLRGPAPHVALAALPRPAGEAGGFGSHPCGGGARPDLALDRGRPADARGARRPRARSDCRARVGARATT